MRSTITRFVIQAIAGVAAYQVSAATPTLTGIDLGTPSNPGSVTKTGDKITVVGGGSDIWNNSDNGYYAYFEVTGDFDYVVKVESLVGNSGDGGWSKAELMARQDDGSGFGPQGGDPHISNMTTRPSSDTANGAPAGVNYRGPQWRAIRDNASSWTSPNPGFPPNMPDNWMRMERIGSVFYMYTSNDGKTWSMYNPYDPQGWDTAGSWPPGTDSANVSVFQEAWPAKINLGLAVTAHNDGATTEAVFSNFGPYTPVPIQITTQPPATLNIAANSKLELKVVATGDPVHYIWRKDGNPVPTNGLGATYTIPLAKTSDSGKYTVKVHGGGKEVISSECVVTVTVDTTPPTLTKANGSAAFTTTTVQFSEPVSDSALTAGNYKFDKGLTVSSVARKDEFAVVLTHSKMAENTVYQLTVSGVQDTASPPNTIAANSTINVQSYVFKTGVVLHKFWENVTGNNIAALEADPRFPDNPTFITIEPNYEYGPGGSNESGSNYGNQLIAWFIAPSTGDYVFFTNSDDPSNLYLSTDDNPANKKLIAQETGWSNARQWQAVGSGDLTTKCSATFGATEWPDGNIIHLTANKKYYMESLHTEGGGGDSVGGTFVMYNDWVGPDAGGTLNPANGSAPAITGTVVGSYVDPTSLPPVLKGPTANTAITLAPGASTTMTIEADGATSYKWQLNGRDIPGATSASYTIASAQVTHTGQYWGFAINDNGSVRSALINVLVTATGVFNIEAEDFDYDSGKTKDEASVMPYMGGAYDGLSAIAGVDYNNDDDPANNQENGHPFYRYGGDLSAAGKNATMGREGAGSQFSMTRMGEWTMTSNYKIGWIGNGNWGNYTRTFPTPAKDYYVFSAQSYDGTSAGQIAGTVGIVTAGVGTATQTVQTFGSFNCPGTAGWSRNNLTAMTDDAGAIKTVQLGGKNTIRWNYNSGDADYLVFVPASGGGTQPKFTSIVKNADGTITVTWEGGGTLQAGATVLGPWQDVTGATSPYTLTPTAQMLFGRLKQ